MTKKEQAAFWAAADKAAKDMESWPKWKRIAAFAQSQITREWAGQPKIVASNKGQPTNTKQYIYTQPIELEPRFSRHMEAMTAEGLHDKGDIAVQLSLRDKRIAELEAMLLRTVNRLNEIEERIEEQALIDAARDLLEGGLHG